MFKKLLVLVFISLVFFSCGEKNNKEENALNDKEKYSFDSSDVKTEGVDNSGKPFLIEYKFKKGDKYTYRLTTISDNTQKIKVDTTITSLVNQEIVYLLDMNIKEADADGNYDAELLISSLKLDAKANGQSFSFEAGKDKDTTKIKQFGEFEALYKNPFNVRFSKKGELLEVYKADKILDKFLEIRGAKDTISAEEKSYVRQDLINSVLNPLVTQVIRKVPDKEVYKDSTWEMPQRPFPLMVYQINYINKYKLESVEKLKDDRIAVIDANISFTYTGNPKVKQGNVSYDFDKPKSQAGGKIFFDVDKGIQIKSRTNSRLEITYSMEANTPKGKQKGTRTDIVGNTNILELI
jgi:outer membrane lipoprotein-sorting protein